MGASDITTPAVPTIIADGLKWALRGLAPTNTQADASTGEITI